MRAFPMIMSVFVLSVFCLSGCGFTPLYSKNFSANGVIPATINISPIPERLGQLMRARLMERLNDQGEAEYRLDVVPDTSFFQFGLRGDDPETGAIGDAAATQEQVTLRVDYDLVKLANAQVVFQNSLSLKSSFDLVLSDFAIVTQREDTVRRLGLQAVERIEREIALYFKGLEPEKPAEADLMDTDRMETTIEDIDFIPGKDKDQFKPGEG